MEITPESVFTHSRELCDDLAVQEAMGRKLTRLLVFAMTAGGLYGATMGVYHSPLQAAVSAIKVPALFILTLAVCLPTFHFVGLLFGSPVRFGQSLVVFMNGVCQTSVLLGAFAPISLFFLLSRSSYAFLLLMHVAVFAFCGGAGLASVLRNFAGVRDAMSKKTPYASANTLLWWWMLLYMFVGTQMAYNLAPFINREGPVTVFNTLGGNFYSYLWAVISDSLTQR